MTASGRKKMDELYHPATERSEFYTMSDLTKPPVLFTPAEDIDKVSWVRLFSYHICFILLLESMCRIVISAFIS
jgi:transcription factor CP2-like protein